MLIASVTTVLIPHPKIPNLFLLPRTTPYIYVLRCVQYVFDVCNTKFTVYYGQILVWFGINYLPQGTIELILRDDFGFTKNSDIPLLEWVFPPSS